MDAVTNRPVGRPRQFDEAEVLRAVVKVFWRQGYEGTSMADLLQATGLHKGSLYQAFGDKRSLFIRALRDYVSRIWREIRRNLEAGETGIEGLRQGLYFHVHMGRQDDDINLGCMALNTLVENGPEDPEVGRILKAAYRERMRMVTEAVARAQAEGSLRPDWKAERMAAMINVFLTGMVVSMKGPLDERQGQAMIDDFLEVLA